MFVVRSGLWLASSFYLFSANVHASEAFDVGLGFLFSVLGRIPP